MFNKIFETQLHMIPRLHYPGAISCTIAQTAQWQWCHRCWSRNRRGLNEWIVRRSWPAQHARRLWTGYSSSKLSSIHLSIITNPKIGLQAARSEEANVTVIVTANIWVQVLVRVRDGIETTQTYQRINKVQIHIIDGLSYKLSRDLRKFDTSR